MRLGERVTCREFIEFLAEYLDGELETERRAIFEAHLDICDSCVEYVRTYKDTITLGKAADDEDAVGEVPETLVSAILAARPPDPSPGEDP